MNPFEHEFNERNNFPDLSPLKPLKPTPLPQSNTTELTYGDVESDVSSFSEDLEVFEDFEDGDDIVIDAGNNTNQRGSSEHIHTINSIKESTKGQNIELNWSIDAISTLKPAEVSLLRKYYFFIFQILICNQISINEESIEEEMSPSKLDVRKKKEDELQRKSSEYFEKGVFTRTPIEVLSL